MNPSGRPGRTPQALRRLAAAAVVPFLAACGDDHIRTYPQSIFDPKTEQARIQGALFDLTLYLGVAVGIAVFALLGYIIWKYRARPGAPEPAQTHGNTRLELAWTLVPAIILAVIAIPTVRAIVLTQPAVPQGALIVDVIGKQWWWEFRYPTAGGDTVVTANEVHVPVGRPVALRLMSDNVLHSFWVPQMGGKRDLVPNHANWLIFTPEEPGVYLGQCAEFCGESHALMRMRLVAHTPEGFERWLQNEAAPAVEPPAADSALVAGRDLFARYCIACHTVRGMQGALGKQGPDLTHVGRRRTIAGGIMDNNFDNLVRWIHAPTEVKPGSKMINTGWTLEQSRYIAAYLQSLQ